MAEKSIPQKLREWADSSRRYSDPVDDDLLDEAAARIELLEEKARAVVATLDSYGKVDFNELRRLLDDSIEALRAVLSPEAPATQGNE